MIKSLYDRGLDGEQVRLLFKFLDSMLVLPRELEKALSLELAELELTSEPLVRANGQPQATIC